MTTFNFKPKSLQTKSNNTKDKEYIYPGFISLGIRDENNNMIKLFDCSISIDKLMSNKRKKDDHLSKMVNTFLSLIHREYEKADDGGVILNDIPAKILNNLVLIMEPTSNNKKEVEYEVYEDLL